MTEVPDASTSATLEDIAHEVREIRRREDSTSARVWEVAVKLTVPAILAVLGWLWSTDRAVIRNGAGIAANGDAIRAMDARVTALPPEWLREIVQELRLQNVDVLQRLSRLEAKLEGQK